MRRLIVILSILSLGIMFAGCSGKKADSKEETQEQMNQQANAPDMQ